VAVTFKITNCDVLDKDSWNDAITGLDVSVYFSWEYLSIIRSNYPNGIYLLKIFNDSSGIVTFYTYRTKDQKYYDIYSPYGSDGIYIWGHSDEVLINFVEYLKKNNIVTYYMMNHPMYKNNNRECIIQCRNIYTMDLTKETEVLWKDMHANHRYEINKLTKQNIYLEYDKSKLKSAFLTLYRETFSRVQANISYNFTDEFLSDILRSDLTLALGAVIDENIECVVLFLVKDKSAEYFINASSLSGRTASRYLIWEMIRQLKDIGVTYLNLGGGVVDNDSLDQFKKRFGGQKTTLNMFSGVALETEFERLCFEHSNLDETIKFFPPYWANNS
jgi:hypothetical protein